MTPEEREEVLAFLHQNPMGVISTIHHDTGAPESALVAFAETAGLEIVFQTFNDTRKYANLHHDSRVALVIGWQIEKSLQITFQYEGRARELEKGSGEYEKYRTIFEQKDTPCSGEFLENPKSRLFVITARWLRYSDYSGKIPRIIENTFGS